MVIAVVILLKTPPESEPMLNRWVGFFFLFLLGVYLYVTYLWVKRGGDMVQLAAPRRQPQPWRVAARADSAAVFDAIQHDWFARVRGTA